MLLNDKRIKELAAQGMIEPFEPGMIRNVELDAGDQLTRNVFSYGTGSFGYDLRLSPNEFFVFRHIPGTVINPKRFNPKNLERVELQSDEDGDFFIIPGNSYGLGVALEYIHVPSNITVIFIGKSSYARAALIANVTPAEAGWKGHLTLEFSNSSPADCRIYAREGVIQALFLEGEPCETTYEARSGKYQNQGHQVTIARV